MQKEGVTHLKLYHLFKWISSNDTVLGQEYTTTTAAAGAATTTNYGFGMMNCNFTVGANSVLSPGSGGATGLSELP